MPAYRIPCQHPSSRSRLAPHTKSATRRGGPSSHAPPIQRAWDSGPETGNGRPLAQMPTELRVPPPADGFELMAFRALETKPERSHKSRDVHYPSKTRLHRRRRACRTHLWPLQRQASSCEKGAQRKLQEQNMQEVKLSMSCSGRYIYRMCPHGAC